MFSHHFSAMQKREDYVCKQPLVVFSVQSLLQWLTGAGTAQSLKSQLLIITAVGYYKPVKSIPVTADACTTTREPWTSRTKDGGFDFSFPYPDGRKTPQQLDLFLSSSIGTGLAACYLVRNSGQVVIQLALALVEEAVIFCSQGLGLLSFVYIPLCPMSELSWTVQLLSIQQVHSNTYGSFIGEGLPFL